MDICEWVDEGREDISSMNRDMEVIHQLETDLKTARDDHSRLETSAAYWAEASEAAQSAKGRLVEIERLQERINESRAKCLLIQTDLEKAAENLVEAEALLARANAIVPLRTRSLELPSLDSQLSSVNRTRAEAIEARKAYDEADASLKNAEQLYSKTVSVGRLTRLWRRLPDPEMQRKDLESKRAEAEAAHEMKKASEAALLSAKRLLVEITELNEKLQPYADVPEVDFQRSVVRKRTEDP